MSLHYIAFTEELQMGCQLKVESSVRLTHKKQFRKGRTSFCITTAGLAGFLQVTAGTIGFMLLQLWPQTMGQLAVPHSWKHLHEFLEHTPLDSALSDTKDDLVGFFKRRSLDAVQSLIFQREEQHPNTVLSVVMPQRGSPVQLSYVGKHE